MSLVFYARHKPFGDREGDSLTQESDVIED